MDVTRLLPQVDGLPPVRGKRGRTRRKPVTMYADRGHDHDSRPCRLRERGGHSEDGPARSAPRLGLSRVRGVVEPPLPGSTALAAYEPAGKPGTTCTTPSSSAPTACPSPVSTQHAERAPQSGDRLGWPPVVLPTPLRANCIMRSPVALPSRQSRRRPGGVHRCRRYASRRRRPPGGSGRASALRRSRPGCR